MDDLIYTFLSGRLFLILCSPYCRYSTFFHFLFLSDGAEQVFVYA